MSTTSSSYTSEDDGVDDDDSDEDDDDEDDLDDGNEYDAILRADEKRRRKKQRKKRKKQLETPPQSVMVSLLDVRALRARNVRPPPHLSAESANSLGRGEGGTSAARLAEQRSLVLERPLHPKDVRVGTVCTAWVPASNRHERAVVVAVASASALRHVHSGSVSGAAAASSAAIAATSAASGSSLVPYGTSHDDDQDEEERAAEVLQLLQVSTTRHRMTARPGGGGEGEGSPSTTTATTTTTASDDDSSTFEPRCSICLEEWVYEGDASTATSSGSSSPVLGDEVCRLRCGHPFHADCITRWAVSSGRRACWTQIQLNPTGASQ